MKKYIIKNKKLLLSISSIILIICMKLIVFLENEYVINDINIKNYKVYMIDEGVLNGKNERISPIEISEEINKALQNAAKEGYAVVTLPKNEYVISEDMPIKMLDNVTFDLNQSTLKINPHGKQSSTIIDFSNCKNAKLINGTLLGDRYEHDYDTIEGSHEWNCGVTFNNSENCELNNVTVKSFTGYGVSSSLGENISNLVIGVTKFNLEEGNISTQGKLNKESGRIRTIEPLDIRETGEKFELGYNKGYMGYPYMKSKDYDSYFYDKDMNFISSTENCVQYKKVDIPKDAVYVHFVFNQPQVPTNGDTDFESTTVFLTNYQSPYKITISNCTIEDNRSLGMGLCGGREFIIENNTFKSNKGAAPGYAIDLEDGWEYMDNYIIRGNKFIDNGGDVVVCAGDNILLEDNHFTSTVYMWPRTTNYSFLNNTFENILQSINYEYSTDTLCEGNTYINSKIAITNKSKDANMTIRNETLVDSSVNAMSENTYIENSAITSKSEENIRLTGSYKNCNLDSVKAEATSINVYDSIIKNSSFNGQGINSFYNSKFEDTVVNTTSNTEEINSENCDFINSKFLVSTWGSESILNINNSTINIDSDKDSFIEISAGKTSNLVLNDNKLKTLSSNPIISMYDTSYSIPNANINIERNEFYNEVNNYIFDGNDINSGVVTFNYKNNNLDLKEALSSKYKNNKYFKIKQ